MATGLTLSVQQLQALLDAPASDVGLVVPEPALTNTPPRVTFSTVSIGPPSSSYIGPGEVIGGALWNSVASAQYRITGRMLRADGTVARILEIVTPTSDRALFSFQILTGEGFLLNLSLEASFGAVTHGQAYARLMIASSALASATVLANLVSGYPTLSAPISWPGGKWEQPGDGSGALVSVTGTNPAAGAEWLETVPTNTRWKLRQVRAQLVTAVAAATRIPYLVFISGGAAAVVIAPSATQAASLSVQYNGVPTGSDPGVGATNRFWQISQDLALPAGGTFGSSTLGLQAADDWAAPVYMVEEWITV